MDLSFLAYDTEDQRCCNRKSLMAGKSLNKVERYLSIWNIMACKIGVGIVKTALSWGGKAGNEFGREGRDNKGAQTSRSIM